MSQLDETALRALVREAVARHLGQGAAAPSGPPAAGAAGSHASHFRYTLMKSGGPCLIEPAVACNSCGYCESHGH